MHRISIAIFITNLFLINSLPSAEGPKARIIPLCSGNYWNYTFVNDNGDSSKTVKKTSLKIIDSFIKDEICWYVTLFNKGTSYKDTDTLALAVKPDGLWLALYTIIVPDEIYKPFLFLKYPTYSKDKNILLIPKSGNIIKTHRTNVKIKVPAGTFKCIDYLLNSEGGIHLYVCPNIGIIKVHLNSKKNESTLPKNIVLTDYKIN